MQILLRRKLPSEYKNMVPLVPQPLPPRRLVSNVRPEDRDFCPICLATLSHSDIDCGTANNFKNNHFSILLFSGYFSAEELIARFDELWS